MLGRSRFLASIRPRFFYGWNVLGVSMLGAFLAAGTSQLFMSIMLVPLSEEFGWSRTAVTAAVTAGTLAAGAVAPFFGRLADRYGPRVLTAAGALFTGVVYWLLAGLHELWQLYVFYLAGRAVAANTLSGVVPTTAMANWFRRRRGRAMGLLAMATPLGGSCLAFTGQLVLEAYGWRAPFILFAVVMLTLLVLPAALILRRRPEDLGLLPDGEPPQARSSGAEAHPRREEEVSWTLGQAVRTPALWLLTASYSVAVMTNTAVGFHQVAYYTDMGIAATAAVAALSVYAFSGALSTGGWGFLAERFNERHLTALAMLATAGAIVYLMTVRSLEGALIFSVLFGLTSRGEGTLINIILAKYYGRGSYGAINGLVHPFTMLGLGLGPLVASMTFDLVGSYQPVFVIFAIAVIIAAVLVWLAKKPVMPAVDRGP